jgi:DNA-binding XRE family transcriptional regulator
MSVRKKKRKWSKRVIRLRMKMECTQETLAKVMGLHRNTISLWERGVCRPSGLGKAFLNRLLRQPKKELRSIRDRA